MAWIVESLSVIDSDKMLDASVTVSISMRENGLFCTNITNKSLYNTQYLQKAIHGL